MQTSKELTAQCLLSDRVKQIKNEAVVNENPLEKLIRELREENERLKKVIFFLAIVITR